MPGTRLARAGLEAVQLEGVIDGFQNGGLLGLGQGLDLLQPPQNLAAGFPGREPFVCLGGINRSSVETSSASAKRTAISAESFSTSRSMADTMD